MSKAIRSASLVAAASVAIAALTTAQANETAPIKLKLRNGDFEVQGTLVKYDGKSFVIDDRTYGRMTFEADRFACVGGPCPTAPAETALPQAVPVERAETIIKLNGSGSVAASLAPELVRAFAAQNEQPLSRILGTKPMQVEFKLARTPSLAAASMAIEPSSAAGGLEALQKGEADIALTDRPANDAEQRALAGISPDLRGTKSEHVVALDAVAVVVHQSRAMPALTMSEFQGILAGTIRDWSELKQAPGAIEVIVPSLTSTAMEQIRRFVLLPGNKTLSTEVKPQSSMFAVADAVARSPNAIGITSFAATDNVSIVGLRGACGLDARPQTHSIQSADYPLMRRLYFYTAQEPQKPVISAFVTFAKSEKAQAIVREQRYVDQSIAFMPDEVHAQRFAHAPRHAAALKREADWQNHQRDLTNARRLTATFRFPSGRSELDAKADQDLTRLAAFLADPQFQGREVLIIGYADALGRYDLNATLAANRAQKVRTALLQRGGAALQGRTLTARGHGPHAPVLCNDDPVAQETNRRVEIWVRN